jgi:DNA replication initiation complex subunit (GINS family)
MIEYSKLVKDIKDLNSYWKANQANLDKLKVTSPELYAKVRDTFSELKKSFTKE